jgi:hypothetical protein
VAAAGLLPSKRGHRGLARTWLYKSAGRKAFQTKRLPRKSRSETRRTVVGRSAMKAKKRPRQAGGAISEQESGGEFLPVPHRQVAMSESVPINLIHFGRPGTGVADAVPGILLLCRLMVATQRRLSGTSSRRPRFFEQWKGWSSNPAHIPQGGLGAGAIRRRAFYLPSSREPVGAMQP